MKQKIHALLPHILFVILVVLIFLPSIETVKPPYAFLIATLLIEVLIIAKRKSKSTVDIGIIVYIVLILWEIITAKIGVEHQSIYPPPENVFIIYQEDYAKILKGIFSSLGLMAIAFGLAIVLGVGLGLFVGISKRLTRTILPISKVLSPIPPIIFSPYAVAIMPSFRSASIFIIFLAIFWNLFMSMILGIREIDKKLLESAKTLDLSKGSLIWNVLMPYSLPGILNSLTVSVSTSFLVLTAAEMIGATAGLGWYVKYHSDFAHYANVLNGFITIGIVVTLLNKLIGYIRSRLIRWK